MELHALEWSYPESDGPPLEPCLDFLTMVMESNGELFCVFVANGGIGSKEVVGVDVFRLDLFNKKWVKTKSLEGQALVQRDLYVPRELIRSNCVYFFHHCLYSFNLGTNGLISYAPPPTPPPLDSTGSRPSRVDTKFERKISTKKKKEDPGAVESSGSALGGLPYELVLEISRRLPTPRDRLSFRAVNKLTRSAMPAASLTDSFKEQRASLPYPWLLSCRKHMDVYTLIDPLSGDRYSITLAGSGSGSVSGSGGHPDAAMSHCNGSWCVMVQGARSIFLWNPFTKEKITLPGCPDEWNSIAACGFMNSPHSPDFLLSLLCVCQESDQKFEIYIDMFRNGEWTSEKTPKWSSKPRIFQSTLCVRGPSLWLLDNEKGTPWLLNTQQGDLSGVVLNLTRIPTLPDYKRSYLVECGTDILAVVTSVSEDDVQVFKFDVPMWSAVDNLDDFVLYISHFSSFSRPANTPAEGNRIYFPRLYDGKLAYYSLRSKRYHCIGGELFSKLSSCAGGFQQGTLTFADGDCIRSLHATLWQD